MKEEKLIAKVSYCLRQPSLTESDIVALFKTKTESDVSCSVSRRSVENGSIDFAGSCSTSKNVGKDGVSSIRYNVNGSYEPEKADARLSVYLENYGGASIGKVGAHVIATRTGDCDAS
jgi:hypothetical protein